MQRGSTLGKTGLEVCRLGLSSSGISASDLEYGISAGLNFVFHSTDLHAFAYHQSVEVLRKICGRGSPTRGSVVLAACSYVNDPRKLQAVLVDQLYTLGVDHVDVFMWGWVSAEQRPDLLISSANHLREPASRAYVDEMLGVARAASDALRCAGYARFVGVSTHDRRLARELYLQNALDILMLRYNIAHRGAENDIFGLAQRSGPGLVCFNATHDNLGSFTRKSRESHDFVPTHLDLYRFVLKQSAVDVVLAGLQTRQEIDAALAVFDDELDPAVDRRLRLIGDRFYEQWRG